MVVLKRRRVTYNVVGFTTANGVLVDLDKIDYKTVKKIADKYCKEYKLNGYLILETSKDNYAIIFDKIVTYKNALSIIGKIAFYLGKEMGRNLSSWILYQIVKKSFTIRVSSKGKKDSPKIVDVVGETEQICRDYLELYKAMKLQDRRFFNA